MPPGGELRPHGRARPRSDAPARQPPCVGLRRGRPPVHERRWPRSIEPAEVSAAVWSSIIHGARGIVYFNHSFGGPAPTQHALREPAYAAVRDEVTRTNARIQGARAGAERAVRGSLREHDRGGRHDGQVLRRQVLHFRRLAGAACATGRLPRSVRRRRDGHRPRREPRRFSSPTGRSRTRFADGNAVHIYRIDGGRPAGCRRADPDPAAACIVRPVTTTRRLPGTTKADQPAYPRESRGRPKRLGPTHVRGSHAFASSQARSADHRLRRLRLLREPRVQLRARRPQARRPSSRWTAARAGMAGFSNPLPTDASYFPIGVWFESVVSQADVDRDKDVGLNTYVVLTTNSNLPLLRANGMRVFAQHDQWLASRRSAARRRAGSSTTRSTWSWARMQGMRRCCACSGRCRRTGACATTITARA